MNCTATIDLMDLSDMQRAIVKSLKDINKKGEMFTLEDQDEKGHVIVKGELSGSRYFISRGGNFCRL